MTALLLNPTIQRHIDQAIERARLHPLELTDADMKRLEPLKEQLGEGVGKTLALEDRPEDYQRRQASEHVEIPFGYLASISFEVQPEPLGMCKHLSISAPDAGMVPNQFAVQMVAEAFGMLKEGYPRHLWFEEFAPGHLAINIVEPVEWPAKENSESS